MPLSLIVRCCTKGKSPLHPAGGGRPAMGTQKKKTIAEKGRWSCVFLQAAGKLLSVLTAVHPMKSGSYSPPE
jgi:hypothetical protein